MHAWMERVHSIILTKRHVLQMCIYALTPACHRSLSLTASNYNNNWLLAMQYAACRQDEQRKACERQEGERQRQRGPAGRGELIR